MDGTKSFACSTENGMCPHFYPFFHWILNQLIKIVWQFGFKSHLLAAGGVFEGNRFGMKR
jgi:hypothetical protein